MKPSVTDQELKEYLTLKHDVKVMLNRMNEIKEKCKLQGSFYTANYVCSISIEKRTGLVGLQKVLKVIDRDILEKYELIQTTSYLSVDISELPKDSHINTL